MQSPRAGGSRHLLLSVTLLLGLTVVACTPHRGRPSASAAALVAPPLPAATAAVTLVRVGLGAALPGIVLEATGPVRILDERRRLLARLSAGKITCGPRHGRVAWSGGVPGGTARAVLVVPEDPALPLRWQGRPYPGEVWVLPGTGGLTLVDVVPLEEYLRGVVPWEIGRHGEEALAALCAQAVAARTYTVSHLGERETAGFDLWADVRDQVYRGLDGGDPWTDRAIRQTHGLVLWHAGEVAAAYYSACCGGWSSDIAAVWPRPAHPYLVAHPDTAADGSDWCAAAATHDWRYTWSAGRLSALLQRTLPGYLDWWSASPARGAWAGPAFSAAHPGADPRRPGRLLDLAVVDTTPSGRVAVLRVDTEAGTYRVRGDRVRWLLPPPDDRREILPSARFRLQVARDAAGRLVSVTAVGHGNGHGIGLCQAGALAMARAGRGWRDILAHYYPGTTLVSWPFPATARHD